MSDFNYQGKQKVWKREGSNFLVEVKRWRPGYGENIWNIYVYLYPKHPLFEKSEDGICNSQIDFHGGCTHSWFSYDKDGDARVKEYGCDYAHYGDGRFGRMKTKEDAYEIFNDAREIYEYLSNHIVEVV